jgi:predicted nucleic-acid-binding protein
VTLLDSNILIRLITGDDPKTAHRILAEIESAGKNNFYITSVVLVEVCFVLEFHDYAMQRKDIYAALSRLIGAPQVFASKTSKMALELYKKNPKLDFADCYLLTKSKDNGAKILTLDKDLQKLV